MAIGERVGPCAGGCWYCGIKDEKLDLFCCEFDTYMHLACLKQAIADHGDDPDDRELQIIIAEFRELLTKAGVRLPPFDPII